MTDTHLPAGPPRPLPDTTPSVADRTRWSAALDRLRSPQGWLYASDPTQRFGSLFGRDSLISALALLPFDPTIAERTLTRLGVELGAVDDPELESEPGKVIHESRDEGLELYERHGWPVRHGRLRYYGSIDASLWFLIVYGALARYGHRVLQHTAAARRVQAWLHEQPLPLTYTRRARHGGLAHQWWRDVAADLEGNGHGMITTTGRPMQAPVAVAAVGALAWRAWAEVTETLDRHADIHARRAHDVFLASFQPAAAPAAFARHRDGLDSSPTSDLGIVCWTGVVDGARLDANARRLLDDDLMTAHGVRTLPHAHAGFRPDGYHTGSVWPFDSWLAAGGLAAAGYTQAASKVTSGVIDALDRLGGYPELYVVDPDDHTVAPSKEACSLQAWTVASVSAISLGWDGRSWA